MPLDALVSASRKAYKKKKEKSQKKKVGGKETPLFFFPRFTSISIVRTPRRKNESREKDETEGAVQ